MTLKIFAFIACVLAAFQTVTAINKNDFAQAFYNGFILILVATFARIYF